MAPIALAVGAMIFVMVYAWHLFEVYHRILEIGVFA
jgi:hypothetical protein